MAAACLAAAPFGPAHSAPDDLERCRAIPDPMARARCFQSMSTPDLPAAVATTPRAPQSIGRWRLVQTRHPEGGKDAIAINRPGELSFSDPDFVGLTIRCAEPDIEVLLVTMQPRPLRTRVPVLVNGRRVEGTVAPPGVSILLPPTVAETARKLWPSMRTLSFEIGDSGSTVKGHIQLEDYERALAALSTACTVQPRQR